ncbi:MAG: hypothetical protein ACLGIG_06290 [Actinomycetes bacterium]
MRSRATALSLAGLLALGGVAACTEGEEDQVEQQVDEGVQDVEGGAEDAGEEIDEETEE